MIINQEGNTSIITQEKTRVVELVKKIQILYPKFENNNIIIVLNTLSDISNNDFSEFINISNNHKLAKHSFVIVSNKANPDLVPNEVIVTPTIQEAFDIIEMEEIERDLGF